MVSFISSWSQQIIFAVIIGVIIQMLIPEGKNKKYIKIVIGVYVLFAVISPVAGKNLDLNLNNLNINLEKNNDSIDSSTQESINDMYVTNLKQDIINKLKNKGYGCDRVELITTKDYEIEKMEIIGIFESKEDAVEKIDGVVINEIQIGEKENSIEEQAIKGIPMSEEKKLKEYLSETYNVKEKNIRII